MNEATNVHQGFLVDKFSWFYLFGDSGFVIFSTYLMFSKYGKIKLGRPDMKPFLFYVILRDF